VLLATAALAKSKNPKTRLSVAVPGAALLFPYDGSNLSRDLVAGLSVAVVPVGVAYTQWAGFHPAFGFEYLPTQPEKEYSPNGYKSLWKAQFRRCWGATCRKVLAGSAGSAVHSVDGRGK
jgi:hypothetical protein